MKTIVLASFCSLAVATSSHASFTGFAANSYALTTGGQTKWVLDLYTCHSTTSDVLLNIFDANIAITGGFGPGSIVHNDLVGGSWCPQFALDPACDSFVTIGGQPGFTNSTSADPNWGGAGCNQPGIPAGAGWFNGNPANLQGQAANVLFQDGTSKIGVWIGRFVTTDPPSVPKFLTITASLTYNTGLGTPPQFGTSSGNFLFCIPAPGVSATIGLFGLFGSRRRRCRPQSVARVLR